MTQVRHIGEKLDGGERASIAAVLEELRQGVLDGHITNIALAVVYSDHESIGTGVLTVTDKEDLVTLLGAADLVKRRVRNRFEGVR